MKNFGFTFCLILLPFIAQAEFLVKGKVTDLQNQPIPFVNVGFVDTTIGTISTVEGEFVLYLSELPDNTIPLRFSCMGFEPMELVLIAESISDPMHIKMKESTILLQEMVVKPSVLETIEYGNKDEKTSLITNLAINAQPNMNLGAEIGRKFRLGKEPKLYFKIEILCGL
jgi:hypothetical protein